MHTGRVFGGHVTCDQRCRRKLLTNQIRGAGTAQKSQCRYAAWQPIHPYQILEPVTEQTTAGTQ